MRSTGRNEDERSGRCGRDRVTEPDAEGALKRVDQLVLRVNMQRRSVPRRYGRLNRRDPRYRGRWP
jgi:hypothetical protein